MKKIIFIGFVLAIFIGAGFYYFSIQGLPLDDTSGSQSSKNIVNISGVSIEGDGDIKIEPIEIKNNKPVVNIPLPNLDKEIKITNEMSDEAKKIAIAKIQDLSSQLKKDSDNLENWLVLGVYRKTIGDLAGAKDIWEYAGAIRPQNSVSFNNLGELYAYYLKDSQKAEENYAKAIENDPSAIYIYRNFFDFYRYVAKDSAKARALLEKGIAANPSTSSDLKNLLETFK